MRRLAVAVVAIALVHASGCGGQSHGERSGAPATNARAGAGSSGAGGIETPPQLDTGGSGNAPNASGTGGSVAGGGGRASDAGAGTSSGGVGGTSGTGGTSGISGMGLSGAGASSGVGGSSGAGGASGSGTSDAGAGNSAGEGPGDAPVCGEDYGTCECDWQTATCSIGSNFYVGRQCPPTLDDALLVANWPLGGPPMPGSPKGSGEYEECDDGTREFSFTLCGNFHELVFNSRGQLSIWMEQEQMCTRFLCPATTAAPATTPVCHICAMSPDPPAEGQSCFPTFMNNGPETQCMVDANGRWLMPKDCEN